MSDDTATLQGTAYRRLAAIMIADVFGYSRLMGEDERATYMQVRRLQQEIIEPAIKDRQGRLIKTQGDGFLAMFDSAVAGVRCGITIQRRMQEDRQAINHTIHFRIGINLGDVIVEPNDVFGDGVNIAARLEQMAEPDSINISGVVYDQVRHKVPANYRSLGKRRAKNIRDPISVYRVSLKPTVTRRYHPFVWAAAGGIALTALGGGWFAWRSSIHAVPSEKSLAVTAPAPLVAMAPPLVTTAPPVVAPAPPVVAPAPPVVVIERPAEHVEVQIKPPDMVAIPGGTFLMGGSEPPEQPVHQVNIAPFWIAKHVTTNAEWRVCLEARGCDYVPRGDDNASVTNVNWHDAIQYVNWLSQRTKQAYRLPSEAEWEYAVRAGSTSRYWWGDTMKAGFAVCKGCGGNTAPPSNPFGLEVGNGVMEWVMDCWSKDYRGAPINGSARMTGDCHERVLRGGAWNADASYMRSASSEPL